MKKQAESFGAKIEMLSATHIEHNSDSTFTVTDNHGKTHDTRALILATGAAPRKLEIEGARHIVGFSFCIFKYPILSEHILLILRLDRIFPQIHRLP